MNTYLTNKAYKHLKPFHAFFAVQVSVIIGTNTANGQRYRATGVWHRTVPFTPEKILMGMADPDWHEKDLRVK